MNETLYARDVICFSRHVEMLFVIFARRKPRHFIRIDVTVFYSVSKACLL